MRRAIATLVALTILLTASRAAGGPLGDLPELPPSEHMRLTSGEGFLKIGDRNIVLPMGTHILTPPAWDKLDLEVKRLQIVETRLTAENEYMKHKVSGWQPGYKWLIASAVVGLAGGIYLGIKL